VGGRKFLVGQWYIKQKSNFHGHHNFGDMESPLL
jgi:hypothetical protein